MKIRTDFVTNSSSSSFIIAKKNLTENQLNAIRKHRDLGEAMELEYAEECWAIRENEKYISGSTVMDNFNFENFLSVIGVPDEVIKWGEPEFAKNTREHGYVYDLVFPEDINCFQPHHIPGWEEKLKQILEYEEIEKEKGKFPFGVCTK